MTLEKPSSFTSILKASAPHKYGLTAGIVCGCLVACAANHFRDALSLTRTIRASGERPRLHMKVADLVAMQPVLADDNESTEIRCCELCECETDHGYWWQEPTRDGGLRTVFVCADCSEMLGEDIDGRKEVE
jgi:hypothetical protein